MTDTSVRFHVRFAEVVLNRGKALLPVDGQVTEVSTGEAEFLAHAGYRTARRFTQVDCARFHVFVRLVAPLGSRELLCFHRTG